MIKRQAAVLLLAVIPASAVAQPERPSMLGSESFKHYIESFNERDEELYVQHVPNAQSFEFISRNVPRFECPDADIERTYYFRWWTFRKHIKSTRDGFVITEFLPDVPWAGKHNTISCPAAHHFREGRWLRDGRFLNDYEHFWFRGGASPRTYTFWAADAFLAKYRVDQDREPLLDLLPDLIANYEAWEAERRDASDRLFWQFDGNDGGEVSIGGHGRRPTINAAMFGEARAIAEIARMAGNAQVASRFDAEAALLKRLVQEKLWDPEARFFRTLPRQDAAAEPRASGDLDAPRHTWWSPEHLGTTEWVQYDWGRPQRIESVEVYWFQDAAGCRVPEAWRLLVRQGGEWRPVSGASEYGTELDAYNTVSFPAIRARSLRIEATLKPKVSSGILRWRVLGPNGDVAPLATPGASWTDEYVGTLQALNGRHTPLTDVRELYGYMPWYFGLPDAGYEDAWAQLTDPAGFYAPFGPTTAEQRHPGFKVAYEGHECQWNGPSWPFATSITLHALANVLRDYPKGPVGKADYLDLLRIYTRSHRLTRDDGTVVPWIDENLNPFTGDWIARTLLHQRNQPPRERGKDYNHSTYCDLIITGLVGLRPRADSLVEVDPLLPRGTWDYFCLDGIPYHGRTLTIAWDRSGDRYGLGRGLHVLADGTEIASAKTLRRTTGILP